MHYQYVTESQLLNMDAGELAELKREAEDAGDEYQYRRFDAHWRAASTKSAGKLARKIVVVVWAISLLLALFLIYLIGQWLQKSGGVG